MKPLPEEVADIYDAERWNSYLGICKEEFRVDCVRTALARGIDLVLIFSPFFSQVDKLAGDNYLLCLLLSMAVSSLINLPIGYLASLYNEFRIQKRYGLSNYTLASFHKDYFISKLSGFVLSAIAFSALVVAFRAIIDMVVHVGGDLNGALKGAGMLVLLILGIGVFISLCGLAVEFALYKFRPMPAGEVRSIVEGMLSTCKKKVRWLTIYNESEKSNERNAFLLNIPGFRMISIADNEIDDECPRETLAVIAHEVGHLKHRFVPADMIARLPGVIVVAMIFVILKNTAVLLWADSWIRQSFCLNHTSAFLSLQFFALLFGPISLLLFIPKNFVERQHEYEADRNAVREGYGADLAKTLKDSYREELAGVNPHPLIEILEYDHPALPKRLRAIYEEMDAATALPSRSTVRRCCTCCDNSSQ